jgi:hypothetical protein
MVKAMLETGITPDFIVVDGAEGGTGAAPVEFTDHVGVPLQEGLLLVHNTLVGVNLRHRIKIGAAGKVITAFDIARMMALGADWCNFGRGFMMALGCIQAQSCHTGPAPPASPRRTPVRQQALVVPDKATRVANFHRQTLHALRSWCRPPVCSIRAISRPTTSCAAPATARCTCCRTWCCVQPGALLGPLDGQHNVFQIYWPRACAESFHIAPPPMTPSAERPQKCPAERRHGSRPARAAYAPQKRHNPLSAHRPDPGGPCALVSLSIAARARYRPARPHPGLRRFLQQHASSRTAWCAMQPTETLWLKRVGRSNAAWRYRFLGRGALPARAGAHPVPNPGGRGDCHRGGPPARSGGRGLRVPEVLAACEDGFLMRHLGAPGENTPSLGNEMEQAVPRGSATVLALAAIAHRSTGPAPA